MIDNPISVVILSLTAVLGLVIGSFLNVVIYRVPLGLSIVSPPSACPGCGTEISARDNVPVLSWLMLRGKCRTCSMRISIRYPIVELVTAVLFLGTALFFTPAIAAAETAQDATAATLVLVAFLYLAGISVALAAVDLDVHRLPNVLVLPGYGVGIVLLGVAALLTGDLESFGRAAAGSGILFAFYFLLAFAIPGGMGMGDVKLAGVLGLFLGYLGWAELTVGVASAFVLGGVVSAVLIVAKRAGRKSGIPFGPWMVAGAWFGIFVGERVASGYLSLVGLN